MSTTDLDSRGVLGGDTRAGRVLRNALSPAFGAILAHPFVRGLTDGTLPRNAFARYIGQNYLYLASFARALALLASRGQSGEDTELFGQRAAFTIATERTFNAEMLDALGLDEHEVRHAEPGPVTLAYSSYVLATAALGERPEAYGAVLPCYLVYSGVGRALARQGSPEPRYQRWIDTYVSAGFDEGVRGAQQAVERATASLPDEALEGLTRAARTAGRYEWMFWEAAWTGESWPNLDNLSQGPEKTV
jgi:thiaminase (transcriptional activator TenA)